MRDHSHPRAWIDLDAIDRRAAGHRQGARYGDDARRFCRGSARPEVPWLQQTQREPAEVV
jgi:hypothetical protein